MSITQITPIDALEFLKKNKNSILIDVRTSEEFNFVGFVDSASFDNRMILIPWQILPAMEENKQFAIQIEDGLKKIFKKPQPYGYTASFFKDFYLKNRVVALEHDWQKSCRCLGARLVKIVSLL